MSTNRLAQEYELKDSLDAAWAVRPVSAFPDELYQLPRSWAERAYPKLIHYNKREKGGHFSAWEQPKVLVEELRTGSSRCVVEEALEARGCVRGHLTRDRGGACIQRRQAQSLLAPRRAQGNRPHDRPHAVVNSITDLHDGEVMEQLPVAAA